MKGKIMLYMLTEQLRGFPILQQLSGGERSRRWDLKEIRSRASSMFGYKVVSGDVGADGEVELLISEPGQDRIWVLSPSALFSE